LRNTLRDEGPNRAEIYGLLASTAKEPSSNYFQL